MIPSYLSMYTKEQVQGAFSAWQVTEAAPKKGSKVVINFPPGSMFVYGEVTLHGSKSTYGAALYRVALFLSAPPVASTFNP